MPSPINPEFRLRNLQRRLNDLLLGRRLSADSETSGVVDLTDYGKRCEEFAAFCAQGAAELAAATTPEAQCARRILEDAENAARLAALFETLPDGPRRRNAQCDLLEEVDRDLRAALKTELRMTEAPVNASYAPMVRREAELFRPFVEIALRLETPPPLPIRRNEARRALRRALLASERIEISVDAEGTLRFLDREFRAEPPEASEGPAAGPGEAGAPAEAPGSAGAGEAGASGAGASGAPADTPSSAGAGAPGAGVGGVGGAGKGHSLDDRGAGRAETGAGAGAAGASGTGGAGARGSGTAGRSPAATPIQRSADEPPGVKKALDLHAVAPDEALREFLLAKAAEEAAAALVLPRLGSGEWLARAREFPRREGKRGAVRPESVATKATGWDAAEAARFVDRLSERRAGPEWARLPKAAYPIRLLLIEEDALASDLLALAPALRRMEKGERAPGSTEVALRVLRRLLA